jgi:glycogen debranching enzyme
VNTRDDLHARAIAVLERNRRGDWTCPSSQLYPHQWLWDSCFVAIGLARVDPARAGGELRALFRGQWANGMLPHMIFAPDTRDIGSRRIWRSRRNPLAPRDVDTSCITQPPLVAIAARRVAAALGTVEARSFLTDLVPRIVEYHSWLYAARDLNGGGLLTLVHPWECGLDTTPPWMSSLARMRLPWWLRVASDIRFARVLRRLRYDTRHLPLVERPSDDDGLRMLALATEGKRHQFDARAMLGSRAVLLEDLAFNAMLVAANRDLEAIAGDVGFDLPSSLVTSFRATETSLDLLWDADANQYFSRDARTGAPVRLSTVATLLPLWSGALTPERRRHLVALLDQPGFSPRYPVPSVPVDAPEFRATGYWKGPTWVNVNWILVQGLVAAGEAARAATLRDETLDLVQRAGYNEYFSPLDGSGHGAPDFSWTAALVLDLLEGG